MRMVRQIERWLVVVAAVAAWSATPAYAGNGTEGMRRVMQDASRIDTTINFSRQGGTVDLSLVAGAIRVKTSNRPGGVRIQATTDGGKLTMSVGPNRLELAETRPDKSKKKGDATFEITVPAGTRVFMNAVSGDLSATGTRGEVDARTVSGDVSINGAAGSVNFEVVSGDVQMTGIMGAVRGTGVSGNVTLTGVTGDVDVQLVSGDLSLTDVLNARSVRAVTVSGDVKYQGPMDFNGRYELVTHSGDIQMSLPRETRAKFTVETFSGELSVRPEMGALVKQDEATASRRHREFSIGGTVPIVGNSAAARAALANPAGTRVLLRTFSGDISFTRLGR